MHPISTTRGGEGTISLILSLLGSNWMRMLVESLRGEGWSEVGSTVEVIGFVYCIKRMCE